MVRHLKEYELEPGVDLQQRVHPERGLARADQRAAVAVRQVQRGDRFLKKLFTITVPALLVTALAVVAMVEIAVRARWDPFRGRPALFISDPVRSAQLSAHYD